MFYKTLTLKRNFSINTKCEFYGTVLYAHESAQHHKTQKQKQKQNWLRLDFSLNILLRCCMTDLFLEQSSVEQLGDR